jgi:EAL domain-containing protein (putative c-di-GMP-specific phosphodiesterase class I)
MKRFPIDAIKIDRSFVQDLPLGADDKGMAEAIIGMGRALGLTVIAEGVEAADQETFLRKHAGDELQGISFSKPVSSDDLATLLYAQGRIPSPALQPLQVSIESREESSSTPAL